MELRVVGMRGITYHSRCGKNYYALWSFVTSVSLLLDGWSIIITPAVIKHHARWITFQDRDTRVMG